MGYHGFNERIDQKSDAVTRRMNHEAVEGRILFLNEMRQEIENKCRHR
jgi:hypothetical protein